MVLRSVPYLIDPAIHYILLTEEVRNESSPAEAKGNRSRGFVHAAVVELHLAVVEVDRVDKLRVAGTLRTKTEM